MAILQTDVPMTSDLCRRTMAALANRYPAFRLETLTTTAFDRPVQALRIGRGGRRVGDYAAPPPHEWITPPGGG